VARRLGALQLDLQRAHRLEAGGIQEELLGAGGQRGLLEAGERHEQRPPHRGAAD